MRARPWTMGEAPVPESVSRSEREEALGARGPEVNDYPCSKLRTGLRWCPLAGLRALATVAVIGLTPALAADDERQAFENEIRILEPFKARIAYTSSTDDPVVHETAQLTMEPGRSRLFISYETMPLDIRVWNGEFDARVTGPGFDRIPSERRSRTALVAAALSWLLHPELTEDAATSMGNADGTVWYQVGMPEGSPGRVAQVRYQFDGTGLRSLDIREKSGTLHQVSVEDRTGAKGGSGARPNATRQI